MEKIRILTALFNLLLKHPISFIKNINIQNWKTLKNALKNEPITEILRNARSTLVYFENSDIQKDYNKIDKFFDKVSGNNYTICISHEASITGAPLIALNIGKYLKQKHSKKILFILCKPGQLNGDFNKIAPTYILNNYNNILLKNEIDYFIRSLLKKNTLENVIFNSEGSTKSIKYFSKYSIPVTTLIHEMGSFYLKNSWKHINKYSDHIIFPCKTMLLEGNKNTKFNQTKTHVLGQGLLKTNIYKANRESSRKFIIKKLSVDKDAIIILSCGSTIARKGVDIWSQIAINCLYQNSTNLPIHFVWLGSSPLNDHLIWLKRDIELAGFTNNIHLIDTVTDTIPYFVGSDLFLLSSRGDPFPCVAHEALAAGLPVIAFYKSGGTADLINENIGFTYNYSDIISTVFGILEIAKNKIEIAKKSKQSVLFAKKFLSFTKYVENLNNYLK